MFRCRSMVLLAACAATFLFAASSGPDAAAQNVRPAVQVDLNTTGSVNGCSVASSGDLSAVVYDDPDTGGSRTVSITLSDGRGIDWSLPVRVDEDFTSGQRKLVQGDSVQIIGDTIYVAWQDERFGNSGDDVFINISRDGGATWEGEKRIDKGYPVGNNPVREWRFVVVPGSPHDLVYFILAVDGGGYEDLFFVSSHNGGMNFSAARPVSAAGTGLFDVDGFAVDADGLTVHVAWQDNRNGIGDDVHYQRSDDGGATWFSVDQDLDVSGPGTGNADGVMDLAASGNWVAVGWLEDDGTYSTDNVHVNISGDSGFSWLGDRIVADFSPGNADADSIGLSIGASTPYPNVVAAWADDRMGYDEVFVSSTSDGGQNWRPDTRLSFFEGEAPRISKRHDEETMVLTWLTGDYPNRAEAAFSLDHGVTWEGGFSISSSIAKDIDLVEGGFNRSYNNAFSIWLAGDYPENHLYVGGYRPQTLTPVGVFAAGNQVHFEVADWTLADTAFGVLISSGPGSFRLPYGDDRETGLFNGLLLGVSMGQIPGLLSGIIAPDRTGSTPDFTFPYSPLLPPGTALHCAAVGFDSGTVPPTPGVITDIVVQTVR